MHVDSLRLDPCRLLCILCHAELLSFLLEGQSRRGLRLIRMLLGLWLWWWFVDDDELWRGVREQVLV